MVCGLGYDVEEWAVFAAKKKNTARRQMTVTRVVANSMVFCCAVKTFSVGS